MCACLNVVGDSARVWLRSQDSDGDGKIEKWEKDVYERIQATDADQNGSISAKELFGVIKGAAQSDKEKRLAYKLLAIAVAVIIMLIGSMLAVSIAAGEMVKESHVTGGLMTDAAGAAVRTDIAESDWGLFTLPEETIDNLSTLKKMSLLIDGTNDIALGNQVVEATFQLAGVIKLTDTVANFFTTTGSTVSINSAARTGTITIGGTTYPVGDGTTPEVEMSRRRLEKRMARRGGGFLSTSGSFVLSAGGGNHAAGGG